MRWAPLGVASMLALASVGVASAQEQEEPPQEKQAAEMTVDLATVGESGVRGTAVVRFAAGQDPAAAPERVEIRYDVSGLEASTAYTAVIHQGDCATGTTTIADLGTVEADADGRLQETVPVQNQNAIAALAGERDRVTLAPEREPQEMSREGTRHLQLQLDGRPVACGEFQVEPGA